MKRALWIIGIVAVLALAGWFIFQRVQARQAAAAAENFQTVPAERGTLVASIGATGQVHASQSAVLTWQTSGIVDQVNIAPGEKVEKDQVLLSLDQNSLPQNVILAEAELISAQQALEDLKTNTDNAKSEALTRVAQSADQVRDAQFNLDNFTIPANQKNLEPIDAYQVMKEKLDLARQAFEPYKFASESDEKRQQLKDDLARAQSDFDAAVRRLQNVVAMDVAESNLEKASKDYITYQQGPDPKDIQALEVRIAAAQATLNLARLKAPFAGTMTDVRMKPGDQVSPGTQALRLDDLTRLEVDVRVPEVDVNQIQLGQEVELTFDAILDQVYRGVVTDVAQVGTANQGVVEYVVTVELDDPDQNVRPGMTAAANFVVTQIDDVLMVPNRAVRFKDANRVVYILKDGVPTAVRITLGASSETMSQVLDGDLKVGDLILLNPPVEFENSGPPF